MSETEYQQQTKLYDTVDKIYLLLHGQDGQTGLAGTVAKHDDIIYGSKDTIGIATKVAILWRGHVWLYCTLSAAVGSLCTVWIQRYLIK